jgi:hypothetical protein
MSHKGVYTKHTIESLMEKTVEVGDCREWQGYVGNSTPQVSHNGKMWAVRRLMYELGGDPIKQGWYAAPRCGNSLCVCQQHTVKRTEAAHRRISASKSSNSLSRVLKIASYRREHHSKIDMEIAMEIRLSTESGPVLSERYGISNERVNQIKRGDAWKDYSSPFAGLGAR